MPKKIRNGSHNGLPTRHLYWYISYTATPRSTPSAKDFGTLHVDYRIATRFRQDSEAVARGARRPALPGRMPCANPFCRKPQRRGSRNVLSSSWTEHNPLSRQSFHNENGLFEPRSLSTVALLYLMLCRPWQSIGRGMSSGRPYTSAGILSNLQIRLK